MWMYQKGMNFRQHFIFAGIKKYGSTSYLRIGQVLEMAAYT